MISLHLEKENEILECDESIYEAAAGFLVLNKAEKENPLLEFDKPMYKAAADLSPAAINLLEEKLKDLTRQDGPICNYSNLK